MSIRASYRDILFGLASQEVPNVPFLYINNDKQVPWMMYLLSAQTGGFSDVIIRQKLLRRCLKGGSMATINMLYVDFINFVRRNKIPL
ncbi:hypothetical protein BGAL_0119g00120 [Botrytis galanthina]|uniref:Uncharacterized protein n=1 Tax=Botrytis galanthina TaxID=278940 RepID=A0A4S8RCQ0_9HELO|nr:hypothetical protein BGAL_0119g00120 [Botrytis galanthina]